MLRIAAPSSGMLRTASVPADSTRAPPMTPCMQLWHLASCWPFGSGSPRRRPARGGSAPARPGLEGAGAQSLVRPQGEAGDPPGPGRAPRRVPRAPDVLERDQGARGDPGDRRRPRARSTPRLLLTGAEAGHPVQFVPKFEPPTGSPIAIEVQWRQDGKIQQAGCPPMGQGREDEGPAGASTGSSPAASALRRSRSPRNRATPPTRAT